MAILNGSQVSEVKAAVDAAIDSLHSSLRELNREVSIVRLPGLTPWTKPVLSGLVPSRARLSRAQSPRCHLRFSGKARLQRRPPRIRS